MHVTSDINLTRPPWEGKFKLHLRITVVCDEQECKSSRGSSLWEYVPGEISQLPAHEDVDAAFLRLLDRAREETFVVANQHPGCPSCRERTKLNEAEFLAAITLLVIKREWVAEKLRGKEKP